MISQCSLLWKSLLGNIDRGDECDETRTHGWPPDEGGVCRIHWDEEGRAHRKEVFHILILADQGEDLSSALVHDRHNHKDEDNPMDDRNSGDHETKKINFDGLLSVVPCSHRNTDPKTLDH